MSQQSLSPWHRRRFLYAGAAASLLLAPGCSRGSVARPAATNPPRGPAPNAKHPATVELPSNDPFAVLRGYCDAISGPDTHEFGQRRGRLVEAMRRDKLDLMLFEAGLNLNFFTGVRWGQSERPLLYALFADGKEAWTGPAFEALRLEESIGPDAEMAVWQEQVNPYEACVEMLVRMDRPYARAGLDPDMRLFVAEGLHRAFTGSRVESGASSIEQVRMIKQGPELARLRRANEATKAALRVAAPLISVGMRESEARTLIRDAQAAAGLSNIWVLALFGPNAAFPHGTSQERVLQEGDLVLVDTGGELQGYQSDISRTWAPAGASDEAKRAWRAVLDAQTAALALIRPGRSCGEPDAAARKVIEAAGFGSGYDSFTHRLGHGIGIQGHERPYLRMRNETVLQSGMTMSNEPGIYRPGAFGVRIEDIVAVTDTGVEIFGPRPLSLAEPFGPT